MTPRHCPHCRGLGFVPVDKPTESEALRQKARALAQRAQEPADRWKWKAFAEWIRRNAP